MCKVDSGQGQYGQMPRETFTDGGGKLKENKYNERNFSVNFPQQLQVPRSCSQD